MRQRCQDDSFKTHFKDIIAKLSLFPSQRHHEVQVQNSLNQTAHRHPSHSSVTDCFCHSGGCGSHSGEARVVNALLGFLYVFFWLQKGETLASGPCSTRSAINHCTSIDINKERMK